jgi:Sulfotransferase family
VPNEFDVEILAERAAEAAGSTDFGDPAWREGADRLADDLVHAASLNDIGRAIAEGEIVDYLTSRARIVAWTGAHPEISEAPVRPPIVIVGQPRTGTTILFDVLSQDPVNRVPLTWEVDRPWPPPQTATYETDPRIDEVQATLEGVELLIPGFFGMHALGARLAQECVRITGGDFRSLIFATEYRIPEYQRWLLHEADMTSAYRYHRLFLQHLQSEHPGERWVIKSPAHLWCMDSLMAEYPDALIVQTHRDPVRVVCSLASVTELLRRLASDHVDITQIAAEWVDDIVDGLDRAVAARTDGTVPADRAVDVQFADFLADPMAVVDTIYSRIDIELGAEAEDRMRAFLAENPREKHGGHAYRFADTGLDLADLRDRTQGYRSFFGVPDERVP